MRRNSKINGDLSQRNNGTVSKEYKRYHTLRETPKHEYPKTYEEYKNSTCELENDEIISARAFSKPQRIIAFNASARNVTGGIPGFMEGLLNVKSGAFGFLKNFNSHLNYVKVENAKMTIHEESAESDLLDEREALLEIPFVEVRKIEYLKDGAKEFKLVFNSQYETDSGISYAPHTLSFSAHSAEIAEDWVKAILIGCINTSLFLQNLIGYFSEHKDYRDENRIEEFHRQIVDLSTLGRGLLHKSTTHAQEALSQFLFEKNEKEEAEFWHSIAYENNIRIQNEEERELIGLSALQDFVNDSIRAGNIELHADYNPGRRTSFIIPSGLSFRLNHVKKISTETLSTTGAGDEVVDIESTTRRNGSFLRRNFSTRKYGRKTGKKTMERTYGSSRGLFRLGSQKSTSSRRKDNSTNKEL